jgi:hypothetical protein
MDTPHNPEPRSWHQRAADRRHWRLRKHSAHIAADDYLRTGKMLCGCKDPPVTVDAEYRHNPENRTCARCKALADKARLPIDAKYPNPAPQPAHGAESKSP